MKENIFLFIFFRKKKREKKDVDHIWKEHVRKDKEIGD